MKSRPWLIAKVLHSTPQEWFQKPLRQVPDADMARWFAVHAAAREMSK
jgi:hypothetical protein